MKRDKNVYPWGVAVWVITVLSLVVVGLFYPQPIFSLQPGKDYVIDEQIEEIEVLLRLNSNDGAVVNARKKIEDSHRALLMSERIGYNRGIIKSHYMIAFSYFFVGDFHKSMEYVEKISRLEDIETQIQYLVQMHYLKGRIYGLTGFINAAIDEQLKALNIAPGIENPNSKALILANIYAGLAYLYEQQGDEASRLKKEHYLSLSGEAHKSIEPAYGSSPLPEFFIMKVNQMIDRDYLDSATIYMHNLKSFSMDKRHIGLPAVYNTIANYYMANHQLDSAYLYLQQALQATHTTKITSTRPQLYQQLSTYFKLQGELDSADVYYTKYLVAEHEEVEKRIEVGEQVLRNIINQSEPQLERSRHKMILALSVSLPVVLLIIFYFYYIRRRRNVIERFETETVLLETKKNISFEELISLAKSNAPGFIPMFMKVYPDFWQKLTDKHPDLTQADQELCAYTYLNFTTKQIADITQIQVGSVQTRRSRLRRKIALDRGVDLYDYLIKL